MLASRFSKTFASASKIARRKLDLISSAFLSTVVAGLMMLSLSCSQSADEFTDLKDSVPCNVISQQMSVNKILQNKTPNYETFHDIDDKPTECPKNPPLVVHVSIPECIFGDLSFYGSFVFGLSFMTSLRVDGDYHIPAFFFTVTVACLLVDYFFVKSSHLNSLECVQKLGQIEYEKND